MANSYHEFSDQLLLQHCSQDDLRAYNALFDRYAKKLYKLGMRYLKVQFAVEELAIDILYSVWARRHQLKIDGDLSSYLFRAMHNKAISYLRRNSLSLVNIDNFHEDSFTAEQQADVLTNTNDAELIYKTNLAQLSPQRRKVFELSREHNLTYSEIATELNLSPNTVENHMVAALSFMRKQYQKNPAFIILS
jgi:RNA polymerase sigma-70 factor (family 1)